MTPAQRFSILKYWQLLECFAWQTVPALDSDVRVRSLVKGFPWPEQRDPTCCQLIQNEEKRLRRTIKSVTWQHSVYLGIVAERKIVEELFRRSEEELDLLPLDFRGEIPMLVVSATTDGKVGEQTEEGADLPAFSSENLEIARWPWALAQWIRCDGKPQAWANDFEGFRKSVIELCRETVLRTEPDGDGFFRLTDAAIRAIEAGMLDVLRERCACPKEQPLPAVFTELQVPRVVTRFRLDPNATFDPPLLNSFFVDDLSQAAADVTQGALGGALDRYIAMSTGLEKVELDRSRPVDDASEQKRWREVFASLNASSLPRGTWPKPFSRQLYFAQQLACNRILMGRAGEEIVGVNGPPGTGKTTLLRDVIADLLVRRAEKLAGLATARAAFGKKKGTPPRTFFLVAPELRGFEIIVASQNNVAVENITRELPNIDDFCLDPKETCKLSPQDKIVAQRRIIADIDHFAEISDAILKASGSAQEVDVESSDRELRPSWGLISAPLGNKARRNIVADAIFPYLKSGVASPFLRAVIVRACAATGDSPRSFELDNSKRNDRTEIDELKRRVDVLLDAARSKFDSDFATAQTKFRIALNELNAVQEDLRSLEKKENDHAICSNHCRELEHTLPTLITAVESAKTAAFQHALFTRDAEGRHARAERYYRNAQCFVGWRKIVSEISDAKRQHGDADKELFRLQAQLLEFVARTEQIATEEGQAQTEAERAAAERPHALIRWLKRLLPRVAVAESRYQSAQARLRLLRERHEAQRAGIGVVNSQVESCTSVVRRCAASVLALEMEEARRRDDADRAQRECPGLLAINDFSAAVIAARVAVEAAQTTLESARRRAETLEQSLKATKAKRQACEQGIARLKAEGDELLGKCRVLKTSLGIAGTIRSAYVLSEAERQKAKPLMGERIHRARMNVFIAAIRLHRAFVLAALPQLRRNLSFACDVLWGNVENDEVEFLGDAWSSLSFLIPVVSTTFASASRLFSRLKPGSLGWAMIDEAGQAPPQYAVGLMRLVRRCVVVGDPLQLPPVVPMPAALTEHLRTSCGVSDASLHAHDCSVQMIADRLTTLGSKVPVPSKTDPDRELWVGCPLYVHNRCAEPIFTISNKLSYGGRMVLGRGEQPKHPEPPVVRPLNSFWLDVARPENTESHATSDDLAAVAWLLQSFHWRDLSHLYVISPFREVRDKVRRIADQGSTAWRENSIGTVHTFQGKQADCVILVLGGRSGGGRRWAGKPANLLNVAASRAKESLVVVGSFDRWKEFVAPFSSLERIKWRPEFRTQSLPDAGIQLGGQPQAPLADLPDKQLSRKLNKTFP